MKQAIFIISLLLLTACTGPGKYDDFANCLTDNGVIIYGTDWCPHCQSQKSLFGNSFKNIAYVNCDNNPQACTNAGVQGYPTWNIKGENYPGEQSLETLAQLSECSLE
jgi:glutaredoxin